MPSTVVTAILGGGRGTRLHPLTLLRAKPAVPLGGKYRLIDIPVSNCINSGYRQIFVLTQFNSASLNRHISRNFLFDRFANGRVEVLAAEQTGTGGDWYQGTADAIRQQFHHFDRPRYENVLILSGDHLYRMDYRELVRRHVETKADVTVSTVPVARERCTGFGIVHVDGLGVVRGFLEKPAPDFDLDPYAVPSNLQKEWGIEERPFLASMGVYVFRVPALREAIRRAAAMDFGRDVLPKMMNTHRFVAHRFDDYWEDIGTVGSFFNANVALCSDNPPFTFWDHKAPMYHRPRTLPASMVTNTRMDHSILSEGCLIEGATIERSVVGLRAVVRSGARLRRCVVMGADFYERSGHAERRDIPMGIGADCHIENAIIDKNARIGYGVKLVGHPDRPDEDGDGWAIRDGIIVVQKNGVIPPGTEI